MSKFLILYAIFNLLEPVNIGNYMMKCRNYLGGNLYFIYLNLIKNLTLINVTGFIIVRIAPNIIKAQHMINSTKMECQVAI